MIKDQDLKRDPIVCIIGDLNAINLSIERHLINRPIYAHFYKVITQN